MKKKERKINEDKTLNFKSFIFYYKSSNSCFFQKEKNNNKLIEKKGIIKDVTFFLVVKCLNKK